MKSGVRRRRGCFSVLALIGLSTVATVVPATAGASSFLRGFGEPAYDSGTPSERDFWFDQSVRANANIARININWRTVVSGKPVQPTNPADPGYDFSDPDRAVLEAGERGFPILITIYHAPEYAEGTDQPSDALDGSWKVVPQEVGDFAQAVASRYSGGFTPLGSLTALPRVKYLEAWNESNLSQYLSPQYTEGSNKQLSGDHYREMLNAIYDGVQRSGSGALVVAGATAPYGDPPGNTRTRPLRFLREVLCLNGKLKSNCKDRANFDILSHHPITLSGGPGRSAIHPDDAAMPDFKNVIKVLRAAEKENTAGGAKKHPAWATEFWWETKPPDKNGVPLQTHARWIEESLYSLWKQGAEAAIYLRLGDDPSQADQIGGEQSGLFTIDKVEKPAFEAFRYPFVVDRKSKKNATVWVIPPTSGTLEIQEKRGSDFRTVDRMDVQAGKPDQKKIRLSGKPTLRAFLSGDTSLPYEVK